MRRQPSPPGIVPAARMVVTDEALDNLIDTSDRAQRSACTAPEAALLLISMPALLRELRQHRRTAALPALNTLPPAANFGHAPLRVS